MEKLDFKAKLEKIRDPWQPHIAGELNGQYIKLVKVLGEFDWHHHEEEDEMFLVLHGQMRLEFRDRTVELSEGEACIVPRGVEHRPVAEEECHVLLFEPKTTLNTGNVTTDKTHDSLDWV